MKTFLDAMDTELIAPSTGLSVHTERFTSGPDGNSVNIQFIRPDERRDRCRASTTSTAAAWRDVGYDGMYRAWGRIIAAQGVAVAMVDFRNCLHASSAPEVEPFPAGLNDCVSGLKWVPPTPRSWASTRRGSSSPARAAAAT